jgi:hypothetical protein
MRQILNDVFTQTRVIMIRNNHTSYFQKLLKSEVVLRKLRSRVDEVASALGI